MTDGWDESAAAWIDGLGEDGDWARRYVLDAPMLARIAGRGFATAIDIGCGEGRFCRMMQAAGLRTCGIDPTAALIEEARKRDPAGDYRLGRAESLDAGEGSFDLAVSYLSLIDIPGLDAAIAAVHRVLRPGGTFLIANLQSFNTAGPPTGWTREADGSRRFYIDHYLDERPQWIAWQGVRIVNWHRPLGVYMQSLLSAGFHLRHFAEPEPVGADDERTARYRRAPYFLMMEWQKAA
ncbi:Methyltransferase domain-containing protein [Kaistia soli DSM 19436]|uniref:Methyltransferase domain-containing protein n=1 Tax=Kaistia soli DSM 19436 TaxID=1122133 RepID=A0A1M5FTQ9_9HYPH|nr:class I SAM-dependent methyltransferase [Kaistia soli]SHF94809.1 Methyltransferase domain-containing protein [Kaistia soli DSM 19436]